jgi:nitrate reductase NapA
MNQTRRDFVKTSAAVAAACAAGIPVLNSAHAAVAEAEKDWQWDKAVCRFCGTGCGIQIATHNGRVVATKGDPDAPVNKGLNCIKGYFNSKIMYGKDRLTVPLLRMKDGKFHKEGDFHPVSWEQAFDVMEEKFRAAYTEQGPTGVGIFASGQYTIPEGYAAAKLMKGGFRSNNIDPNARHCMASAVVGFIQTFGIDEPSGIYDDIEHANDMVLWGSNMAEMHPILWSRITDARLGKNDVKVTTLSTFGHQSSMNSDSEIIFAPNTDLAILNYILREIIHRDGIDHDFVTKHCAFATGPYDIGYGLRNNNKYNLSNKEDDTTNRENEVVLTEAEAIAQRRTPGERVKQTNTKAPVKHWQIGLDDFKKAVEPYTLDFVAPLAKGDPDEDLDAFKAKLQALADIYLKKDNKVTSFWTMGFNQHVRGSWVNELMYSVHLLTGKQAKPGTGAFSLTGQPSACGTAREVGTFAHRLPADMVVGNKKHRDMAEKHWHLPENWLNPKTGSHITKLLRDLEDGSVKWAWVQVNNPFHASGNTNHWLKAARKQDNFIVCSDPYPSVSAKVADLILPTAMIYEKWGMYGNAERRTQAWRQQVNPPGQAMGDIWQTMEFAKRFKLKDFWGEQKVGGLKAEGFPDGALPDVSTAAKGLGYSGEESLYEVLFATANNKKFAWPDTAVSKGHANHVADALGDGWFPEKALFEEYAWFGRGHAHDLAPFDLYYADHIRGLRWPVVQDKTTGEWKETLWRFNGKYDPYVPAGKDFSFYGKALKAIPFGDLDKITDKNKTNIGDKAKIFFRPYAAPAESPNAEYDLWLSTGRVIEHWHTGTMTRRVPELHKAMPTALMYMHPDDANKRDLAHGDLAVIESRRGKVKAVVDTKTRNRMPRGYTFVPFFDETVLINKVTLDATCPMSKEQDFKKCAIKVYKA